MNHINLRRIFILSAMSIGNYGCSNLTKTEDTKSNPGNASLVGFAEEVKSDGDIDFTLEKIKIWKSDDNQEDGGTVEWIDRYTVQLWFKLAEDNTLAKKNRKSVDPSEQYRYFEVVGLRANEDGILYADGAEPGTTFFRTPTSTFLQSTDLETYTVDKDLALVNEKFSIEAKYTEKSGKTTEFTSTDKTLKVDDADVTSWKTNFRYVFAGQPIVSRTRYETNSKLGTKGKMGCLVQSITNDTYNTPSFIYGDVELGDYLQDTKDIVDDEGDVKVLGDDDSLIIKWTEYWHLAHVDLNSRTVKIIRHRYSNFYGGRELPGVDVSDTTPSLSGMESLVRKCNAAAGTAGTFRIIELGGGIQADDKSTLPTVTFNTTQAYCQTLADQSTNTINLTNTNYGCSFNFGSSITAGNWSGTTHTGPIDSLPSDPYMHVEMSKATAFTF